MSRPLLPLAVLLSLGFALLEEALAVAPPRSLPEEIARLVGQLGSSEYRERQEASKELEAIGAPALPALARAAESKDLEVRLRAKRLLKGHQANLRLLVTKLKGHWEIDPKAPEDHHLSVTLAGKHVRDADLASLRWLAGLGQLHLHDTAVTDKGLWGLRRHRELRRLTLDRTPITDAGLLHLRDLVKLESLDLDGASVKGPGLVHLKALSRLESLGLSDTPLTDAGLAHLRGLEKLRLLDLSRTKVGDAGLAHLRKAARLHRLYVAGTRVTDAGLVHLYGLGKLERVTLADARVTGKGIAALKKALPRVIVES
jgi:hypothetical protein